MFHWMLVAPQALKSLLPVEDSFSNNEMRTFSSIRAHQPTIETFNTSLWRRKTKPTSVNYFAIVVLATNKTDGGTFPIQLSVVSVLWNIMFQKWLFITMLKKAVLYLNQYSRIFSGILAGQRAQRPMSLPPVITSAISFIVFFDDTSWRSSAIALLVKLGLFSSLCISKAVSTCSLIFFPLTGYAQMSPLDFIASVKW